MGFMASEMTPDLKSTSRQPDEIRPKETDSSFPEPQDKADVAEKQLAGAVVADERPFYKKLIQRHDGSYWPAEVSVMLILAFAALMYAMWRAREWPDSDEKKFFFNMTPGFLMFLGILVFQYTTMMDGTMPTLAWFSA